MRRSRTDRIAEPWMEGQARKLAFTFAAALLAMSLASTAASAAGLPGFSAVPVHGLPGFDAVDPEAPAKTAPSTLKSSNLPATQTGHRLAAEAREG